MTRFRCSPPADINKDWDVDGSDLAEVARLIQDGRIDHVDEAMDLFTQRFGRRQ